jgi:hypothetical protein
LFDISEILVRWVYEMFGSQGNLNEAYSHFCNLVNWDPPHTQAHRFINRVSDFIDFWRNCLFKSNRKLVQFTEPFSCA